MVWDKRAGYAVKKHNGFTFIVVSANVLKSFSNIAFFIAFILWGTHNSDLNWKKRRGNYVCASLKIPRLDLSNDWYGSTIILEIMRGRPMEGSSDGPIVLMERRGMLMMGHVETISYWYPWCALPWVGHWFLHFFSSPQYYLCLFSVHSPINNNSQAV